MEPLNISEASFSDFNFEIDNLCSTHRSDDLKIALEIFEKYHLTLSSRKSKFSSPLGGSAEIYVEKDEDGSAKAGGKISYTDRSGKTRVEGEAKVDNKGNTSGRVSVKRDFRDDDDD